MREFTSPPTPTVQVDHRVEAFALWKRYLVFCGIGASGLLVDMGLFHLLFTRASVPLEVAKLLAAETALLNNFFWNDRWTFGHRRLGSSFPWCHRLLRFHVICLSGILLTLVLLGVMNRWAGINAEVSNLVAIVLVSIWNFGWSRYWGWATGHLREGSQFQDDSATP